MVLALGSVVGRGEVELRLRVAAAETHVIGDAIPLGWEFENQTAQALGFMWEGCCRLNGKLEVRAVGGEVPGLPVGQALAHMFAKADRLEPGVPKTYDTKVGDWVVLPGTGIYELRGTYRGVLPTQYPQVPRGLALWRTAAVSEPIRLEVLGVDDYLKQREERVGRRGMRVTLSGPDRLPPLEPITYRVVFENSSRVDQQVRWPDDEALWVIDGAGRRVAPSAVIAGATEPMVVPAGGRVEREFALSSDRFEGESLGDYRVFVDLADGGSGRPRVPSNVLPLRWWLEAGQVRELVENAARGAGTGARNAPLKLLRVYLEPLAATLASMDRGTLSPAGAGLAERLAFAGRLKRLQPKPGPVELRVEVAEDGGLAWGTEGVSEAAHREVARGLQEILDVRRHLGWEVTVGLEPAEGATLGGIATVARQLAGGAGEMGGPPAVLVGMGGTNAPVRLVYATQVVAGAAVLRLGTAGLAWTESGTTREVAVGAELAGLIEAARRKGRPVLAAEPGVRWERARAVVSGVSKPGETWSMAAE